MAQSLAMALLRRIAAASPSPSVDLARIKASATIPLFSRLVPSSFLPRLCSSSAGDATSQQSPPVSNPSDLALTRRKPMTRAMRRAQWASPLSGNISDLIQKSRLYNISTRRSLHPMNEAPKRKLKRIHLPTHYVEVSYKLRKAVVFYQPSIAHIPHGIKDRNPVLVTSGTKRGQNT